MSGIRQEQKARTRQRILKSAMEVYAEDGFSAPTSTVANRAQVSHGLVFAHFPTVDDLLNAVLDDFGADLAAELYGLAGSGDGLEALLRMHLRVLIRHEVFYSRLVKEMSYLPGEARDTFIAIQSTLAVHMHQALRTGCAAGIVKDVPLALLFNTWLGLVHYYLMNAGLFSHQGSVLRRHGEALIDCYLELVKPTHVEEK